MISGLIGKMFMHPPDFRYLIILSTMSQDSLVDYNPQVTLIKVPTQKYPANEDVFQLKYLPPTPTNELQKGDVIVRNLFLLGFGDVGKVGLALTLALLASARSTRHGCSVALSILIGRDGDQ